jgi:hypothetical protein
MLHRTGQTVWTDGEWKLYYIDNTPYIAVCTTHDIPQCFVIVRLCSAACCHDLDCMLQNIYRLTSLPPKPQADDTTFTLGVHQFWTTAIQFTSTSVTHLNGETLLAVRNGRKIS